MFHLACPRSSLTPPSLHSVSNCTTLYSVPFCITLYHYMFAEPVWVVVRVQVAPPEDEGVAGLANQLSSITTREAEMEDSDANITTVTRLQQGVASNPFGSSPHPAPSSTPTSFQDHSFGSGSMMSGPGSIPVDAACLERLLTQDQQATPPSLGAPAVTNNIALSSVRASADSTTCSLSAQSQNQSLEWNSKSDSGQSQSAGIAEEVGGVSEGASCSMMDEGNTETS